jgi:hypothetical protein
MPNIQSSTALTSAEKELFLNAFNTKINEKLVIENQELKEFWEKQLFIFAINNGHHKKVDALADSLISFQTLMTKTQNPELQTNLKIIFQNTLELAAEICKESYEGLHSKTEELKLLTNNLNSTMSFINKPQDKKAGQDLIANCKKLRDAIEGPYLLRKENRSLGAILGATLFVAGLVLLIGGAALSMLLPLPTYALVKATSFVIGVMFGTLSIGKGGYMLAVNSVFQPDNSKAQDQSAALAKSVNNLHKLFQPTTNKALPRSVCAELPHTAPTNSV